ncbi:MAG: 1-acyl-sn-glycerol-3-phosphate acyltransferase [Paraglaciecola sp.]
MLALLRIITIFFYFLLINLLLIGICLLRPFHRDNVHAAGMLYSSVTHLLGLKLELRIAESAKSGGPFVFIANHQNSYDLLTICAAVQKGTVTVGKKSLKWIPVFGWVYWLSGNIMIDRKHSGRALDTLQGAVDKIRNRSLSVWFFPEGTRSYGRGLLPFKSGAFRIAQSTNEPLVTICASNSHNKIKLNRWNNGTLLIDVAAPEALDQNKSIKENAEHFHQKMQHKIAQLDRELAQRAG